MSFVFNQDNQQRAKVILARYPKDWQRSALLPLLDLAQRQNDNWLSVQAMEYVAELVGVPYITAYEVASFYTMFNLKPVGRYLLQVCRTTPCWLCGSDDVLRAIKEVTGLTAHGESSKDGLFTLMEVECLGACVNAPMMQINDDYYEDLNYDHTRAILQALTEGKTPKPGSQSGRHTCEPQPEAG
ncbi:MAG: NADH-quinone oxidoreductase subunit NuoE [Pseudomonadota bacterium]